MSLQRRLLVYLLICAPLVWAVGLVVSVGQARHEVNELFDSEMIRLARQLQATLGVVQSGTAPDLPLPDKGSAGAGEADVRDLAIAVWDQRGQLLVSDREGVQLIHRPDAAGFVDDVLNGETWRVYYLQSPNSEWLVAAGQKIYERDELVFSLTLSQLLPWLLVLPVLLAVMAWAVRRALLPLLQLTTDLQGRNASDLQPIAEVQAPAELKPLVLAMNGLFRRIDDTLARERRFTADAAHELRTPLAVLRAQWDVVRRTANEAERLQSEAKFTAGLERMDRLVTQMLALSRLDSDAQAPDMTEVSWPDVVEQAINDCLSLAGRRGMELACEWPPKGQHPLPLLGNSHLLGVMLRNLLDNALRYGTAGSTVWLRFSADALSVENDGPSLPPELLLRMGERFHRPDGQTEMGSGLGVSIVQRIASLHGLSLTYSPRANGQGVTAVLRFNR